jgi:hypothetical protein
LLIASQQTLSQVMGNFSPAAQAAASIVTANLSFGLTRMANSYTVIRYLGISELRKNSHRPTPIETLDPEILCNA